VIPRNKIYSNHTAFIQTKSLLPPLSTSPCVSVNMEGFNEEDTSSSEEDEEDFINEVQEVLAVGMAVVECLQLVHEHEQQQKGGRKKQKKEHQPRSKRRQFHHVSAYENIQRDHVGPDALFGKEVVVFYRLGRPRVEMIIQSLGNSGNPFYQSFRKDKFGRTGASMEAKVLLPLRVLAYGDAPHNYCDYFQMSQSMARRCCREFNRMIPEIFADEYIRLPTAEDLQAVSGLHKVVHGVDGMFGSLDCMHTYWKNCPVAWQAGFLGRNSGPTIVLEAIADYNLFFWHLSYGYSGAMNDLCILNISPLLRKWTEGTFGAMEEEAGVVPFVVGDQTFNRMFVLVDGIYPRYSRFVRGLPQPITENEIRFTKWQESSRKDIERAFGVLQCKWKVLSYPIHTKNTDSIAKLMECCTILHNMAVSDRVMGDPGARYCPFVDEDSDILEREIPTELDDGNEEEGKETENDNDDNREEEEDDNVADDQGAPTEGRRGAARREQPTAVTSVREFAGALASSVAHRREWAALKDDKEWSRLQQALMTMKGGR
jgi:hypothetical protein